MDTPTTTPTGGSGAFNNGMALSPTQVQQFRQQYNIQTPAPQTTGASGGSTDPWATYDAAAKPANQPQPTKDVADLAADEYSNSANQVIGGVKTGADALNQNDGSLKGTAKAVGGVLEGGVDAAAGLVRGAAAPATAIIQKLASFLPKNSDPTMLEKVGQPLNEWAIQHPEAAKNLTNVFTLATAAGGGEEATGLKTTVGEGVDAVKNSVTDSVSSAKDALAARSSTKAAAKEQASLKQSTESVMPHMDKDQRMGDLLDLDKDVKREGVLGTSKTQQTPEDAERGAIAHEYVKGAKDPVAVRNALVKGIKDTSNERDAFSDTNKTPSNFADMRDYLEANNTPSSNLKSEPGAEEAYNRVTQKALDTVYKTMKSSAEESGDFGALSSGKDIRQARIEIDQQIKNELNENTFGTPQYKGVKAAAIDTRNLLNRMEEDLQRYPGQMEQLNKYNADVATLREKGISTNAKGEVTPEAQQALKDKYGLKSTPESEANATKLATYNKKMSSLYDSLYNVAEKYQSSVGKNKIQEAAKNHPVATKVIKAGAKATGLGMGLHLLP